MPVVISVEGPDGAGKGEAIKAMRDTLSARGRTIEVIEKDTTPLLARLSGLIVLEGLTSDSAAPAWESGPSYLARISRELLKAEIAANSVADYVIVDRFLLSAVTHLLMAEIDQVLQDACLTLVHTCEASLVDHRVFLCHAPFDVCWKRVTARPSLSRKEQKGADFNRRFHELICAPATAGRHLTAQVLKVDTSGTLASTHDQVHLHCAGFA